MDGSAVFSIAASQYFTLPQFGCACLTSAAVPVTCGAAIEVPESLSAPMPVPIPAEKMLTPGAVMFGLRKLSPDLGPHDEKLASVSKPGFVIVVPERVSVPPSAATSVGPCPPGTPRNGMVTLYENPPFNGGPGGSGSPVIGPSYGG